MVLSRRKIEVLTVAICIFLLAIIALWRQLYWLAAFTYYYTGMDVFAQPGFDLPRSVPSKNMELLGRIGGKLHTIAIKDNRAYVGYGTEFVVLDISDPASIKKVGSTNLLGLVCDIKLSGNCAYVADGRGGLRIIDISQPDKPHEIASFGHMTAPQALAVAKNHVYLASGIKGVQVLNVENPAKPKLSWYQDNSTIESTFDAKVIEASGNRLFVADDLFGIRVLDLSQPESPRELNRISRKASHPGCLYATDNLLIAPGSLSGANGIWIYEVGNNGELKEHFCPTPDYSGAGSAAMSGHNLLLATWNGLWITDMSNPLAPKVVSTWKDVEHMESIALKDNIAFVATELGQVVAINISDLHSPKIISSCIAPQHSYLLAVNNNRAYVGDYCHGLHTVDVTDPKNLREIQNSFIRCHCENVALSGEKLLVLEEKHPGKILRIYDIRDANKLVPKGSLYVPGFDYAMTTHENVLYVACEDSIRMIDVSNPGKPEAISDIPVGSRINCLAVAGKYMFSAGAESDGKVTIFDQSDPRKPVAVKTIVPGGTIAAIAAEGTNLYVAHGKSWAEKQLLKLDISTPSKPKELAGVTIKGVAKSMTVEHGIVYIANWLNGVTAISLNDNQNPTVVGSYDTEPIPASATKIEVRDKTIYLGAEEAGFLILRLTPGSAGVPPASK